MLVNEVLAQLYFRRAGSCVNTVQVCAMTWVFLTESFNCRVYED